MLDEGLVLPAYDYVIKLSHMFNILDARGAISVTERTGYIGRIRSLARKVAVKHLETARGARVSAARRGRRRHEGPSPRNRLREPSPAAIRPAFEQLGDDAARKLDELRLAFRERVRDGRAKTSRSHRAGTRRGAGGEDGGRHRTAGVQGVRREAANRRRPRRVSPVRTAWTSPRSRGCGPSGESTSGLARS